MNEIVKYNNYMNNLKFTGFTTTDFNFLMTLCNKLRDKDTTEIVVSFSELREKTGYTQHSIKQFISDLDRMNQKLMKITCRLQTEKEIIMFVLFPTFIINLDKQELTIAVNGKFKFILNELVEHFTRFELIEFIQLHSRYSKTLYRLLKQYRITGHYEVSLEDFKTKMDMPKAYTSKRIMDNIINPIMEELKEKDYFKNLKCTVQYAHKRGHPVTGYLFTFEPEERIYPQEKPNKQQSKSKRNEIKNNRFNNIENPNHDHDYYIDLEKQLLNK